MNMAVNPLVATLGGAASQTGGTPIPPSGPNFVQLLKGLPSHPMVPHKDMAQIVGKATAVVASLIDLNATLELGFSAKDLAGLLEGDLTALEQLDVPESDLTNVLTTLSELQDVLRDLIDLLPELVAEFAPEEITLGDQDVLAFASVVEVAVFAREIVSNQTLAAQPLAMSNPEGQQVQLLKAIVRESQVLASPDAGSLALLSDIDGIVLPEPKVKDMLTLTPSGATVLRVMATAVIQSQRPSAEAVDFEASETPLALSSRADQPHFETLDHTQAPQAPQQRPENQISAKFANVLVNQVRQVDIQEGTTRIELSPRGLGSIEVEMRTNSDGSLAVVVRAENDAVLSALREEKDILAAIIGENESGSLDFQEYSQEQDGQSSDNSGTVAASGPVEDETVEGSVSAAAVVNGPELDLVT